MIQLQFDKHKRACKVLYEIDKNPSNYFIIHYSCESFYDINDGHTPRITSIAIYSVSTGQTDSFSIHKMAEKRHIAFADIEKHYDELEKMMLNEYFDFMKSHLSNCFIHWNMRDINYGFKAIEHRYEVLGGEPHIVEDNRKIDLSRLFIDKYGVKYIGHPRMEKLLELNNIKPKDYLSGANEAEAFKNKEYIKLHRSTLRKVDVFNNLMTRSIQNKLKTQSKWYDVYGISAQGVFEYCKNKWWIQLFVWILALVLGAILGNLL